jgi:hypothetical protein
MARMVSLKDIPPESLEDLLRNVETELVGEWSDKEAHYRALLDDRLNEEYLADELWEQYCEGDEAVVAAFNSWLALR